MACKPWRNRPDDAKRKQEIEGALRGSPSRLEAARKLGIGVGALDHAARTYGLPIGEIVGADVLAKSPKLEQPKPAEVPREFPAWTGYRPRAGWTEPVKSKPASDMGERAKRIAVIPDTHVPFHDRKAWSVALGVVRDWKPDRVVIIGDFMDVESVSRHPKSRPDVVRLAEEYHEANLRLDELQGAAPNATWIFIEGNHENRVAKWCNEFGTMDGMLDVPESLYMRPRDPGYHRSQSLLRGMEWVALGRQPYTIDGIAYLHGVYENASHVAMTAQNLLAAIEVGEAVYGHMHTLGELVGLTVPGRAPRRAACSGFLGDSTQIVFRSYVKGKPKPWDVGLLLQEVGGGLVANHPVRILNGRALFAGRVVQAA